LALPISLGTSMFSKSCSSGKFWNLNSFILFAEVFKQFTQRDNVIIVFIRFICNRQNKVAN